MAGAAHEAHQLKATSIQPQIELNKKSNKELQHILNEKKKKTDDAIKDGHALPTAVPYHYVKDNKASVRNSDYRTMMQNREIAQDQGVDETSSSYVRVPALGISLPIFDTVNIYTLSLGAAQYFPNQVMGQGNYVLAGHNMEIANLLFTNLINAQIGQKIELVNGSNVYTYRIDKIDTVGPSIDETSANEPVSSSLFYRHPSSPKVTLYCCTDGGQKRFVVQGSLI